MVGAMIRKSVTDGSPCHEKIGFSGAVRTGPLVPDRAGQVRRCLETIGAALVKVGRRLDQVTRTPIMLSDIGNWEEAAPIHGEVFSKFQPATTLVRASRLIDARWLVEIQADAYVHEGGTDG